MTGEELINTFVAATGLPEDRIKSELLALIVQAGLEVESMSLDELRHLMAKYLQSELIKAKNTYS